MSLSENLVVLQPSTWEVMVRAELGAENRDKAIDLLERLRARYVAPLGPPQSLMVYLPFYQTIP